MRRIMLGLLGGILLLAVIAQFLLPALISSLVARGIGEKIPAEAITAKLTKVPAVAMLDGKFDEVTVAAVNATVGKIIFRDLNITLQDAVLDMAILFREHRLVVQSVRNVELSGSITQEELARYLKANVKGLKDAVVIVDNGKVTVDAHLSFGGSISLAVMLEGKIVGSGQQIKFVTDRFQLNNMLTGSIGNIGANTLTEIQLVDLRNLPFAVGVREIAMEKGNIAVYTDSRSLSQQK
jgi:hypothetical protein